jgi:hypothetical protein
MVWPCFHAGTTSPAGTLRLKRKSPASQRLCRTKESRARPGPPILIPRGGPRPWGSYQQSRAFQQSSAYRCATLRLCRSCVTVRGEVMRCKPAHPEGSCRLDALAAASGSRSSLRLLWPFGSVGSRDGLRCHEARFGMLLDKLRVRPGERSVHHQDPAVPAAGGRQQPPEHLALRLPAEQLRPWRPGDHPNPCPCSARRPS